MIHRDKLESKMSSNTISIIFPVPIFWRIFLLTKQASYSDHLSLRTFRWRIGKCSNVLGLKSYFVGKISWNSPYYCRWRLGWLPVNTGHYEELNNGKNNSKKNYGEYVIEFVNYRFLLDQWKWGICRLSRTVNCEPLKISIILK